MPTAGSSRLECITQLISTVDINSASAVYYFIRWKNFNGLSSMGILQKQKMLGGNETCNGPVWMTQNYEQWRPLFCVYWLKGKELSLESHSLCDSIGGNFGEINKLRHLASLFVIEEVFTGTGRGHVNSFYISNFIQVADIAYLS